MPGECIPHEAHWRFNGPLVLGLSAVFGPEGTCWSTLEGSELGSSHVGAKNGNTIICCDSKEREHHQKQTALFWVLMPSVKQQALAA